MFSARQIHVVASFSALFALDCGSEATDPASPARQGSGGLGSAGGVLPSAGGASQTGNGGVSGSGNPSSGGTGADAGGSPTFGGAPNYTVDPVGNANRAPGFVDLTPPMGEPLDDIGGTVTPAPPAR